MHRPFKILALVWVLMALATVIWADTVSPQQATQIAQNWRQYWLNDANLELDEIKVYQDQVLKSLDETRFEIDTANLYLIHFADGGYVLVPAEDNLRPVLAYSSTGFADKSQLPPAFKMYLDAYAKDVDYLRAQKLEIPENRALWQKLSRQDYSFIERSRAIVPMLQSKWNQGWPYNELCPLDEDGPGGRVYAGCVATSMGQVMKYWNSPITGQGSHSYYAYGYGYQSANFGNTTYLWDEMPLSIGSSNLPIATLLYHAAVSVDMGFSPDGSGANGYYATQAMRNYFKYPGATYVSKGDYSTANWKNLIREQLDNGVPMYYSGADNSSGHAFNCDGYQGTDYFHFNFGWSGHYDGYFYLDSINPGSYFFTYGQAAITNCIPQGYNIDSPRILLNGMGCTAGDPFTLNIDTYPVLSTWNVNSYSINLFYEASGFDFLDAIIESTISDGGSLTVDSSVPGNLSITWNRAEALFGGGTLLKLKFLAKEAGSFPFIPISMHYNAHELSNLDAYMVDSAAPVANLSDTRLNLSNAMHIALDEIANMQLNTSYLLPSWNIGNYGFDLQYDPALVEFISLETAGTLSEDLAELSVNELSPGLLHLELISNSVITGTNLHLATLQFRAIGNSSSALPCRVYIQNFHFNGTALNNNPHGVILLSPSSAAEEQVISPVLKLSCYPNPFNPETNIQLDLPQSGEVEIAIYNLKGQKVRSLHRGFLQQGTHQFLWQGTDENGANLSSGIYLLKISGAQKQLTKKLSLMK